MRYYEHWSPEHIKVLLMIAAVMACVLSYVALKASDKVTTVILRILAVSHLILEFAQDILLVTGEDYEISWILPLHLCNLGIFVNLIAAFSRGKARRIFSEISVMLIMPGALGALLFPDWNYRPIDDPVAIIIFITHTILLLIPIIFVIKGITDIRISHIWYPLVFMLIVVPPIYMFDTKFSVNYLNSVSGSSHNALNIVMRIYISVGQKNYYIIFLWSKNLICGSVYKYSLSVCNRFFHRITDVSDSCTVKINDYECK